jgi:hypothetical protein
VPQNGIMYVGTPGGLAGLIADIGSAGVADGVTLRLAVPKSPGVLRHLTDGVLPILEKHGIRIRPAALATVRRLAEARTDNGTALTTGRFR